MQPLNPVAVDQSHLGDRRGLSQEPQRVELMTLVEALGPRQLDRPIHLGANAIEEGLNLPGCRIRFSAQARTQISALIAVAEPRVAGPIDDQGHNDRDEQNQEIFLEQGTMRPREPQGRNVALHSITSSARSWIVSGIVRPRLCAVLRLTRKRKRVGSSSGRSAGLAPCNIRSDSPAKRSNSSL